MERVKCGKTEQLFTFPVRSYQIAFLSCQQNKLTPSRTFNSTLSGRQAHFISKKENKAAATRPNNILHFAPKYHCGSSELRVSFITLLQAEKRIFQRSFPKLSIQVPKHLDFLQKGPHTMNAKSLKAGTSQDKRLSGIMQHLCTGKLQHPRQLRFYVPVLLAGV